MVLLYFFLCASIVVFFAIKLSDCADWFEKNTKLTGALIGIFLAAATSLPELMSGLAAVYIGQHELAISSILGSNLFNYNIVAATNLAFIGFYAFNRLDKNTNKILFYVLMMYCVVISTLLVSSLTGRFVFDFRISVATIIIFGIYIWSVVSIDEDDDEEDARFASKQEVRKKLSHALLFAVILIISSSILAKVVELVMIELGLSASLAGSILLGASTSLPEFVGALALMRKKQYSVAISSVLSSNLFNFSVLFVLDIFTKISILNYFTRDTFTLLIYGLVNTIILFIAIAIYRTKRKYLYAIPSLMVLGVYLTYLTYSQ